MSERGTYCGLFSVTCGMLLQGHSHLFVPLPDIMEAEDSLFVDFCLRRRIIHLAFDNGTVLYGRSGRGYCTNLDMVKEEAVEEVEIEQARFKPEKIENLV